MGHNAGILDQVIQWRSLIAHLASASQGHHFFPVFSDSDGVKKKKKYCLVARKPTTSVDVGNTEAKESNE